MNASQHAARLAQCLRDCVRVLERDYPSAPACVIRAAEALDWYDDSIKPVAEQQTALELN